ncbi:MAG: ABC transporter ATP-binding protein [Thermoprotei archaeon]|nr:MAG: ABC transporter ATP-binding protein [Thermoprotei archaeon]
MRKTLLTIENLKVYYYTGRGIVRAVDDVSLAINRREMVGLVGESGSGKSTLGYAIVRLLPPQGKIVSGKIVLDGKNLLKLSSSEMRKVRGKEIGMVFQDPLTSLDPLQKVGDQIVETILEHVNISKKEAYDMAAKALMEVGLPPDRLDSYPHQLSGGQRQRVMIALATVLKPKLIIADEPTTALDVIVQDRIMELLASLKEELNTSIILITHDISLAAERADKIAVMYAGHLYEYAPSDEIVSKPLHPYTQGLIQSIPDVFVRKEIKEIKGNPPDLANPPSGCRFHPRCPYAIEKCMRKEPPTVRINENRYVKCWLYA